MGLIKLLQHRGQAIFRQGEDHRDWVHLGYHHHDIGGGIRSYQVAGIDEAKPHFSVDGRGNVAVTELNLVVLHNGGVVGDSALIDIDLFFLVLKGLARDGVLGPCA